MLAYTAFLVVITLVPDLPLVWQVTVPAALFAAVALAAARSYGDTGILLALGIAATGVGIAAILDRPGHRRDLGHRRWHRGHRRRHRAPPRPRPPRRDRGHRRRHRGHRRRNLGMENSSSS